MIHCLVLRVQTPTREYPVTIARRIHPFPCRTRKLSSLTTMILGGRLPGKVVSCRISYSFIAQLAERMTVNHDVAGSSPAGGATKKDTCGRPFFMAFNWTNRRSWFEPGCIHEQQAELVTSVGRIHEQQAEHESSVRRIHEQQAELVTSASWRSQEKILDPFL